jgi:hypothetical protein
VSPSTGGCRISPTVLRQIPSGCAVSSMPKPAAARKTIRARSANLVALNAPTPNRSVAVHTHPTIAPVKPCEPARYPPLQTERTVSHYCWIHMALSSASSFVRNCDKCDSVLPSGVTESSIPTRCTSDVRFMCIKRRDFEVIATEHLPLAMGDWWCRSLQLSTSLRTSHEVNLIRMFPRT